MKIILGVLLILAGIISAAFINVYMLITGIIDIIHGSNILWGIVKIVFRELIGGIITITLVGSGFLLIKKSL